MQFDPTARVTKSHVSARAARARNISHKQKAKGCEKLVLRFILTTATVVRPRLSSGKVSMALLPLRTLRPLRPKSVVFCPLPVPRYSILHFRLCKAARSRRSGLLDGAFLPCYFKGMIPAAALRPHAICGPRRPARRLRDGAGTRLGGARNLAPTTGGESVVYRRRGHRAFFSFSAPHERRAKCVCHVSPGICVERLPQGDKKCYSR